MKESDYSPEEQKDINERIAKAIESLKELQLKPSASISANNVGDDVFALKVVPYLQDIKYSPVVSPIQNI